MYELTPRMLQQLHHNLVKFHELFSGGRCTAWQQEELLVNAIKSDTHAQHQVFWREAGHDDKADIKVRTNGDIYNIQIKSGQLKNEFLILSGHRLGRFVGDFNKITHYLNKNNANIIAIPYKKIDNKHGRAHVYEICYVDVQYLHGLKPNGWQKKGKAYEQINNKGIVFSLRPSMSWQIWWKIPESLVKNVRTIKVS